MYALALTLGVYIFRCLVVVVQDYPKLSQTYYVLLECLAQDHMSFLSTLEPHVFLYILSSISEGLTALGAQLNNYTGLYWSGTQAASNRKLHRDFFFVNFGFCIVDHGDIFDAALKTMGYGFSRWSFYVYRPENFPAIQVCSPVFFLSFFAFLFLSIFFKFIFGRK